MTQHDRRLRAAQAAWNEAMAAARLPRTDPAWVPYTEAIKQATKAWDKELEDE